LCFTRPPLADVPLINLHFRIAIHLLFARFYLEDPVMNIFGNRGTTLLLLVVLSTHAPMVAQETGSAPTAPVNQAKGTVSAQVSSTAGDAGSTADEDWVAFAKTRPMVGPDGMVGEATLFDVKSGTVLRSLRRYGDNLRHVRFSPDGKFALLSFYNKCVLWNLGSGDVAREFGQGGIAHFSADASSILIYGEHQATRHELITGKAVETIRLPFGRGFKSRYTKINAHIDNEERHDASGTLIYNADASSYQAILDAGTGQEVGLCPSETRGCMVSGATKTVLHGGPLHPVNVVRVFDFTRNEIARFDMPVGVIEGLGGELKAVSRDGKQFLYTRPAKEGGENPGPQARYRTRHYSVHDAVTGKEMKALGDFDTNYRAHFSPDARFVVLLPTFGHDASDARDPEILVIDAATGAVDRRMYSGPWALPSLDFDADGGRMLVAGAMNLQDWREFGAWRQMEAQKPMPRKVVDTLKILKDGLAKDSAAPETAPTSKPKSTGT
jgi:hypothetical protein